MYGFILKKNFCDAWDNLLSVVITNILFLLSGLGILLLSATFTNKCAETITDGAFYGIQLLIMLFGLIVLSIIAFAYGEVAARIADFKGITILDFFKEIPGVLKDAILFAILVTAIIFVSGYSLNYYFIQQQSVFGICVGALLFWIDIFIILSLQWFIPLRSTMHNKFGKTLKKCFIIFFDNTGYSILLAINNLVMMALSVLLIGLVPSIAGIAIAKQNALRIRLYKYDYLEEHPELKTKKERKQIPWEELIYEDRETLGPRKLRSFLFPWKDDKEQQL
ncbi:MAG: hypothetical protein J5527_10275 [Treponema sp.]|nr:hypothetical protein [Treponema sp.]